jgi:hypothetical protein
MIHYHGAPITPMSALYQLAGRHFCIILREHIKVDATGLAPVVASAFVTGFDEAAGAISALLTPAAEPLAWRC